MTGTYTAWPVADLDRPAGQGARIWRVHPERPYVGSDGVPRVTGRILTATNPTLDRVVTYPCDVSGVVDDPTELGVTPGADHLAAVRAAGFTPTVEAKTAL